MKARILILILSVISYNICTAQYKYTGRFYRDEISFNTEENFSGAFGMKGIGNSLRIYQKIKSEDRSIILIKNLNLETMSVSKTDTILNDSFISDMNNFSASKNFDGIIDFGKLLIYNRNTLEVKKYALDSIKFQNIEFVNDSEVVLYSVYNYHPNDGYPGINLHKFDFKNSKLKSSSFQKAGGISLSHMNVSWGITCDSTFTVIEPLTGVINVYDFSLKFKSADKVPIRWSDSNFNHSTQEKMDAYTYSEYERTKKINNRNIENNIYNKSYIYDLISQTKNSNEFIDMVIPYDSTIIISIAKPNYDNKIRDVIFYNVKTRKIEAEYKGWGNDIVENANTFEDLFPITITASNYYAPYFYKGKVYFISFLSPSEYHENDKIQQLKHLIKYNLEHGANLNILEYTINTIR